ncbi:hypothetical protein BDN70DRAFT_881342 [Pholiota conissans]|uniref:Secreted protein n=1 Tax=Pholiota conissans TaxID=109636 RepID=A0A9P5YY46_9AGAR|nr:hypothetical protein BDN70DRAFT_881342 [Pholiota conissans]
MLLMVLGLVLNYLRSTIVPVDKSSLRLLHGERETSRILRKRRVLGVQWSHEMERLTGHLTFSTSHLGQDYFITKMVCSRKNVVVYH